MRIRCGCGRFGCGCGSTGSIPALFVGPTNGSVPALILWLPLSFDNNDLVFCGTHCLKYRPDLAFLCHPLSFSDNDKTDVTYHHYSSWHSTLRIVVLAPLKKVSFLKIKQNIVGYFSKGKVLFFISFFVISCCRQKVVHL